MHSNPEFRKYFRLEKEPFGETPDRRFYYPSISHRGALDQLYQAIRRGKGFSALVGEVGSGKTMLTRRLLDHLGSSVDSALILYPHCTANELLRGICEELEIDLTPADGQAFGSPFGTGDGQKFYLDRLNQRFLRNLEIGHRTLLVIDEAQNLPAPTLETIRLLSNFETGAEKLVQIVLVGQPELSARLERPELRQLGQRIGLTTILDPLRASETLAYIRHRLENAGGANWVSFDETAALAIHRAAMGIPRRINMLCDQLMQQAMQQRLRRISAKMVAAARPAKSSFARWRRIFARDRGGRA